MKTTDRSIIITITAFMAFAVMAGAQETVPPEGYQYVDSVIYIPATPVDTALVGKDIFSGLGSSIQAVKHIDKKSAPGALTPFVGSFDYIQTRL